MTRKLAVIIAGVVLGAPVFAHRLDEYLQAIIVAIGEDHIQASMRLIPGVAVSSAVIAAIDLNHDGVFSEAEQQTYAQQVLRDLSVSIDGRKLTPVLRTVSLPAPAEMKAGVGEIHIEFTAELPPGGSKRALIIENHHQPGMSVYLMNCLISQDRNIRIVAQNRNQNQSYYRVDYVQSAAQDDSLLSMWEARLASAVAPVAGVPSMFRLGMRHIAEGADHLLFLIALLLPAPLLAVRFSEPGAQDRRGSRRAQSKGAELLCCISARIPALCARWGTFGGVRRSLVQILRVVTAFTIGHSITLALGASRLVSLPSRPVEVLIAVSILVSAVHALRPLFPGREPMIAAGFGLIHGLAFATTLQNLGVGAWQRIACILGFNLGIETMQLIVVCAILPSLVLLSRTWAYRPFRLVGATFAAVVSIGWIVERLFGLNYSVDLVMNSVAQRGEWIAILLVTISLVVWLIDRIKVGPAIRNPQVKPQRKFAPSEALKV